MAFAAACFLTAIKISTHALDHLKLSIYLGCWKEHSSWPVPQTAITFTIDGCHWVKRPLSAFGFTEVPWARRIPVCNKRVQDPSFWRRNLEV
jgi:hypothetical protein